MNLRRIRTARGLSQVDMAEKAKLSRIGYRNIEAGESEPRVETLNAIAKALDVSLEQLLVPVRPLTKVRFRAQKKLHSRDEVLANVARQLDQYAQLEELLDERKVPAFDKVRKKVSGLRGEQRAMQWPPLASLACRSAMKTVDRES